MGSPAPCWPAHLMPPGLQGQERPIFPPRDSGLRATPGRPTLQRHLLAHRSHCVPWLHPKILPKDCGGRRAEPREPPWVLTTHTPSAYLCPVCTPHLLISAQGCHPAPVTVSPRLTGHGEPRPPTDSRAQRVACLAGVDPQFLCLGRSRLQQEGPVRQEVVGVLGRHAQGLPVQHPADGWGRLARGSAAHPGRAGALEQLVLGLDGDLRWGILSQASWE